MLGYANLKLPELYWLLVCLEVHRKSLATLSTRYQCRSFSEVDCILLTPALNDIIKYLIRQELEYKLNSQTENSMLLSCARFHGSISEDDWFHLL